MFNCFISAQAQQMTVEANAQKPLISLKSVNIHFSQNSKSLKAIYLYIEIRTLKVFWKKKQAVSVYLRIDTFPIALWLCLLF